MAHIRVFRHYLHLPFVVLSVLDGLVLCAAAYLALYLRFFGDWNSSEIASTVTVFTALNLLAMTAMGVYQAKLQEGMSGMMLRTILSILIASATLALFYYVAENWVWYLGRGVLALASVLAIFMLGISRSLFFFLADQETFKHHIVVLGAGERAKGLFAELGESLDQKGFRVAGFLPVAEEQPHVAPGRILKLPTSLHDYVLREGIDEIVIATDDRRKRLPLEDLIECKMEGVSIVDGATFYEREARKISLELIQPSWMIFSDGFGSVSAKNMTKRIFDILASVALLVVTWPIMLLTIFAIKLEEGLRAPVFYKQERVGLNGKSFNVIKFRSMRVDAEKGGQAIWAQKNDTRVTRVGAFIRKVRIDELPQIFNVLRGDMAFVGPRPERPVFVKQLAEKIPFYNERHRVKPGITGWAQLCFAYADSEEDSKEKLRYDLYYIKNQSLLLDLIVLIQTVEVILFKKGAH